MGKYIKKKPTLKLTHVASTCKVMRHSYLYAVATSITAAKDIVRRYNSDLDAMPDE